MVMETVSLYNNMTELSDWLTCQCLLIVVWSLNSMHLFIEFICKTFKALYIGELIRTMPQMFSVVNFCHTSYQQTILTTCVSTDHVYHNMSCQQIMTATK
jgi:flagellar biosynthesis protein FliR